MNRVFSGLEVAITDGVVTVRAAGIESLDDLFMESHAGP